MPTAHSNSMRIKDLAIAYEVLMRTRNADMHAERILDLIMEYIREMEKVEPIKPPRPIDPNDDIPF